MSGIRPASLHDLPGAYRVCLQTADSGRDATALYRNPDLPGHVFVGPYIVSPADVALVVSDELGLAGYVVAAVDTRAFEAWAEENWWPALRSQYPARAGDTHDERVIRFMHDPPQAPDALVGDYPAHLHINLLERVRGQGLGRALIERLLATLWQRGTAGIHLEVSEANRQAIAFYKRVGFVDLERRRNSRVMGRALGEGGPSSPLATT